MIGTEVAEEQVKALMGAAWTSKMQMVATSDAVYSKVSGVWYRYASAASARETFSRPLESELLEDERQEHARAAFEAAVAGEI